MESCQLTYLIVQIFKINLISVCATNQFTCNSGHCIPQDWVCNGKVGGCKDGEDEEKENCIGKDINKIGVNFQLYAVV